MLKWIILTLLAFMPLATFAEEKELTLSLIKPDAVANNHIGEIIARFEKANLHIAGIKMLKMSEGQAKEFYAVHKDKPFFNDLVKYMTSGPIVALVLSGTDAVQKNRELMGATDPNKAAAGTIRKDFALSITKNAVHGSDSPENAKIEIQFFFKPEDLFIRN